MTADYTQSDKIQLNIAEEHRGTAMMNEKSTSMISQIDVYSLCFRQSPEQPNDVNMKQKGKRADFRRTVA